MRNEKPFWEIDINPITGYRITSLNYELTKEFIKANQKEKRNERNKNKTTD